MGTHRRPKLLEIDFPMHVAIAKGGVHGTSEPILRSIASLTGGICHKLEESSFCGVVSGADDQVSDGLVTKYSLDVCVV